MLADALRRLTRAGSEVHGEGRIIGFDAVASSLFGDLACLDGRSIQEILRFVVHSGGTDMQVNWEGRIVDAALRTLVVEVSGARILSIPPSIRDVYIVHSDAQHGAANRLREQVLIGVAQELRGPLSAVADILDSLESEHRKFSEPGIGLGLAIAKGIIEAHGGSVAVETQMNVGTSIWFRLPEARVPGL